MAVRPVDLQLAYLAGPQNAAVVSSAQRGPQAAQQAAASVFAAEVVKREESVDQPQKAQGQKVRPRGDRDPGRQRNPYHGQSREQPQNPASAPEAGSPARPDEPPHLIDFTA